MGDPASLRVASGPTLGVRAGAWAAWAVWLVAVIAGSLGLVYGIQELATGHSIVAQTGLSYAAATVVSAAYASIGLVLRVRRADLVIGWLFLGIGVMAGLSNMTWGYVLLAAASGADPGPFAAANLAWIANALQVPAWFGLATALVLLFPDGRLPGPAWRPVLIGVFVATGALSLGLALAPGPLQFFPFMQNPHAASGLLGDLALVATVVALAVLAVLAVASAWSMVLRYRRGSSVQRQQLKWFAWASTLAIAAGLLEIVMAGAWFPVAPGAADASWLLFTAAVVTVPAAALVAILRYRLYDIDRLIGRTFVYGSLTAILAGLYAASIRLFTAAFVAFTGQSSDGALVLSTLVLATTFTPIKGRLETVARERLHDPGRPGTVAATVEALPAAAADDLDQRIEEIARRVSREVVASELSKPAVGAGGGEGPAR